jgi:hypothetical protein
VLKGKVVDALVRRSVVSCGHTPPPTPCLRGGTFWNWLWNLEGEIDHPLTDDRSPTLPHRFGIIIRSFCIAFLLNF